jgi:hypothetical protein
VEGKKQEMAVSPEGLVCDEFSRKVIQSTLQHGNLGGIPRLKGGRNQLKQL